MECIQEPLPKWSAGVWMKRVKGPGRTWLFGIFVVSIVPSHKIKRIARCFRIETIPKEVTKANPGTDMPLLTKHATTAR